MAELKSPIVVVTLEDPDGVTREYTVQTDNRDMVQFDILRARKEWPKSTEGPQLWMTVLAWHALSRTGQIGTEKVEEFIGRCLQVDKPKPPAESEHEADPTQPVPDTGS